MRISKRSTRFIIAAFAAGSLTLAACSPAEENPSDEGVTDQNSSSTESADGQQQSESALAFEDAYVTAKPAAKSMTSVFGVLKNNSDKDIHLTEVKGSVDGSFEYHIVKDGQMMEAKDGFTIKAGESLTLEPGHEHIMIMENKEEIAAGDTVDLTVTDEEGNTYDLPKIPVRVQQSTHEHYGDGTTGGAETGGDMHHGHDHGHGHMGGMDAKDDDAESSHAGHGE